MIDKLNTKELMIRRLTPSMIKKLGKNDRLFQKFSEINKGFIDSAVLRTIARNKQHPHYNDLFQAAWLGLYKSLTSKKFDHNRASFSTFATVVMQNEVRLELKRLNKQKHVLKDRKHGGYKHLELPLASFTRSFEDTSGEINESSFKDTAQMRRIRNFEEDIINEILLSERMTVFDDFEREIYQLHYVEGLTLREIAKRIDMNYYTLRMKFYKKIKPKFDDLFEELNG